MFAVAPVDCLNQQYINYVRFQVLTAASMTFRIVFWDVLPCKMIVDRRFRGTYWRQAPAGDRTPIALSSQPVVRHYTAWANPAP
jgi:hypothetical protein